MSTKKNTQKKEFAMSREDYIQFLSMRTNEIHVTNKNSKTGMGILDLAFPTCTCREDAPCKHKGACYCLKGRQQMTVVLGAYYRNYRLYNENPDSFFEQLEYKIKFSGLAKVRFFDAGDFPDYYFVEKACELVQKFPDVKFMAFTKKYFLVNQYMDKHHGKLPDNFNIIFSAWDINWKIPNPWNLPVAYVDFKDSSMTPDFPEHYHTCPNQKDKKVTCTVCGKCWKKDIGAIVFKQH